MLEWGFVTVVIQRLEKSLSTVSYMIIRSLSIIFPLHVSGFGYTVHISVIHAASPPWCATINISQHISFLAK